MITVTKKGHGLGWKPQMPSHLDYRYEDRVKLMAPETLVPTDITNLVSTVKNQGQLGACVAHGTTSAFEACQIKAGIEAVLGCRLLVYRDARIIGGDYPGDNGCNIRDGIHATVQDGVAPETDWAYDISQFDTAPPAKAVSDAVKAESTSYYLLDGASTTQMIANIDNCLCVTKLPVVYGMPVYQQYEDVGSDGIIDMPSGASIGGHCNALFGVTGFTDADYYITLNSWGTGWGKGYAKFSGGFGLIPRPYIRQYASDSWTIAMESQLGPTPTPTPPTPTKKATQITITADKSCYGVNKPATFIATLKSGTAAPIAEPIKIYHTLGGATYQDKAAYSTLTYQTSFTSPGIRTYYASFAGNASYAASVSSALPICVCSEITK
jgi:hypothetical protein